MRNSLRWLPALLVPLAASCQQGSDDMSTFDDSDTSVRARKAPEIPTQGGAVLKHVEIFTVVWSGDEDLGAKVDQFHSWMVASDYWASLKEYGVEAGTSGGVIVIPRAAPARLDEADMTPLIEGLIADGTLPPPTENTLLAFVPPASTKSTVASDPSSGCNDYVGFHDETNNEDENAKHVVYSINLQCPRDDGTLSFDDLTGVLSHEAAEAATDPHVETAEAFSNDSIPSGGEVGDLCVDLVATMDATAKTASGGTESKKFVVQRLYSSRTATRGDGDPCLPTVGSSYTSVALLPNFVAMKLSRLGNGTAHAQLQVFSTEGSKGEINWEIDDPGVGISITPSSGTNRPGDIIDITIKARNAKVDDYPVEINVKKGSILKSQWFGGISAKITKRKT